MAEREITLKLTAKEERALAQLVGNLCRLNVLRQYVIDQGDVEEIGRVNAALNHFR